MFHHSVLTRIARFAVPAAAVLMVAAGCAQATPTTAPAAGGASQTEEAIAAQTKQAGSSGGTTLEKPYNESADAKADIAAALATAKGDSKYVLIDFGANWCEDCLVLSKLFEDPSVKPLLDAGYHVVKVDVGYWDKNTDIANQYGNPIEAGIPAIVVLNGDGKVIDTTKAGELANARTATAEDIAGYLTKWAAKAQ